MRLPGAPGDLSITQAVHLYILTGKADHPYRSSYPKHLVALCIRSFEQSTSVWQLCENIVEISEPPSSNNRA